MTTILFYWPQTNLGVWEYFIIVLCLYSTSTDSIYETWLLKNTITKEISEENLFLKVFYFYYHMYIKMTFIMCSWYKYITHLNLFYVPFPPSPRFPSHGPFLICKSSLCLKSNIKKNMEKKLWSGKHYGHCHVYKSIFLWWLI